MSRSITALIILLSGTFGVFPAKAQELTEQVSLFLRNRIEAAGVPPQLEVGEEVVYASVMLPRFYEKRVYRPAWCDNKGPLVLAQDLVTAIRKAEDEGLRPSDYHLNKITELLSKIDETRTKKQALNPRRVVDLELLLTDAFLVYGAHLLAGRVNPETIDSEWFANRREANLAELLETALREKRIQKTLQSLIPPQMGYRLLRTALSEYREPAANGGLPVVPEGGKLQKGDRDARVLALRERLLSTHDLSYERSTNSDLFDDELDAAVRKFQQRHGLDADGTVGAQTLAALNVSASERAAQIEVNLERWRWLPQELGRRYILVNIANFELEVVEESRIVLEMRVVVGQLYRRTPVFSDRMTYLVLCPFWHVPESIAVRDKLPSIRKDSTYLAKQNMKVFRGWGADALEIIPSSVNWSQITAQNFPYRLRQDPGPNNALGRIKFMFPNQFNVYLHDTPSRELFRKTVRAFSSGCIRVEKPVELAEYVLKSNPQWTREQILATIGKWKEQTVRLPEPIPVHLLYWTAWATDGGTIHFRNDIYSRDQPLFEALLEEPPQS